MADIPYDDDAAADAIVGIAESMAALLPGPPDRGAVFLRLGKAFISKHQATSKPLSKEAMIALENALLWTEPDDLRRAEIHERMVDALLMRHDRDLNIATQAMEHAEKSCEIRRTSESRHLSLRVVADCQFQLFGLKGDLVLLDGAIESLKNALAATPEDYDNHFHDSMKLSNMWASRYGWTNNSEDLEESICVLEKSRSMFQMTHHQNEVSQATSCTRLAQLAVRRSEPKHLTSALQLAENVYSTMDANSTGKQILMMLLASLLEATKFFKISGRSQARDLERASHFLEQASLIEKGRETNWPLSFEILLGLEGIWAYKLPESEKHEKRISNAREQLRLVRANDPIRSERLSNLGETIAERTYSNDLYSINEADLKEALGLLQEAWRVENAKPSSRLDAARGAINLRWISRIYEPVFDPEINPAPKSVVQDLNHIVECAMRLLFLECGRDLKWVDQQHTMNELPAFGLAADACFISLRSRDTEEALRRIEFGRGIMLGNLLGSRIEMSDSEKRHPGLVKKYQTAMKQAIRTVDNGNPQEISENFEERRQALKVVEDCERIIREIPGFENFPQPRLEDLRSCIPREGFVVIVNAAKVEPTYADAMIVGESQLIHVPLPDMDVEKVLGLHPSPTRGTGSAERDAAPPDSDDWKLDLTWLWNTCVKPICDNIIRNAPYPGWLPRVWWMGTGFASSFPFHAAGDFSNGKWETCLEYMVPSYTPTIRALKFSRDRASQRPPRVDKNFSLSLVTMPTTPSGFASLNGAKLEGDGVQATFEGRGKVSRLDNASVDSVLDSIKNADAVHFACHGSSDPSNPSNSHLLLEKAGEVDKLTVASILDTDASSRAGIAFLSACSTAEIKAFRLTDEGLHLVNAFQMAGFAHVIGALRPVDDAACVEISRNFYSNLLNSWHSRDWDRAVAEALRDAILTMRELHPNEPDLWAWYTHTGA